MPILLTDEVVNVLIIAPAVLGLLWSVKAANQVKAVKIDGHPDLLKAQDSKGQMASQDIVKNMIHISGIIQEGATAFLWAEYKYMAVYIVLFGIFLYFFTGLPSTISFVVGAITSILAGWIGMKIAVFTNVRTAHQCWKDLRSGYDVAIQGGCVMGLSLVAIGVIDLFALIICFKKFFSFDSDEAMYMQLQATVLEAHPLHSLDVLEEVFTQRLQMSEQTSPERMNLVWMKMIHAILHALQTTLETMLVTLQVWVLISLAHSQRLPVLPLCWLPLLLPLRHHGPL
jgi:inorganic pyrophosphatase